MDATHPTDDEQTKLWNGRAGHAWVEAQESLDQMLKPFEDLLVEAVSGGTAGRVLDVGCGTGSTTLAIARLLGAQGRCIGIDISEPMISAARLRAEREGTPASFICADAQTHVFEPAGFDMIVSRFGVMFFDDAVEAFANLRRAAGDDAELRFVAWRSAVVPYLTRLGPVGLMLHEADDSTRAQVIETVRAAFDPYVHGAEVRFTSACWMVGARASAFTSDAERCDPGAARESARRPGRAVR
jgi:ubiquinone/menaquinone biosynthesis C-methylase UbiE